MRADSPPVAAAEAGSAEAVAPEAVFARFEADCRADRGRLWGVSLCGPLLLVSEDGAVYSNVPDAEGRLRPERGLWTARVAEGARPIYSDTSADWAGTRWAVARLQPGRTHLDFARLALHESFHRIQPQLPFSRQGTSTADHLDELDGRLWLRLSMRALAAALAAPDRRSSRRHLIAALQMSTYRHRIISGSEAVEREQEFGEGLAEYTGWRLARTPAVASEFAAKLAEGDRAESYARSFAYFTGPAWGLAFDRLRLNWRRALREGSPGFAAIGRRLLRLDSAVDAPRAVAVAGEYGYAPLLAEERDRAQRLAMLRAEYRARFVEGPRLVVPLNQVNFDPRTVTSLGEHGQVYGVLAVTGPWGSLRTQQGALVSWARREVVVGLEGEPSTPLWEAPRWRLELSPGWRLERRGDSLFVVRQQP